MESLCSRFYLLGYSGYLIAPRLRRVLAKSSLHRAWLSGYMGSFFEGGVKNGVLDREWFQYRKGVHSPCHASIYRLAYKLVFPYESQLR